MMSLTPPTSDQVRLWLFRARWNGRNKVHSGGRLRLVNAATLPFRPACRSLSRALPVFSATALRVKQSNSKKMWGSPLLIHVGVSQTVRGQALQ
jgi:hypothetical protein